MDWEEINADYEAFRKCVYPGFKQHWQRDDDNGRRHLLDAYAKALLMPEKEHLLYARILWSMYRAFECQTPHVTFRMPEANGFLTEAKKEYELAGTEPENEADLRHLELTENLLRSDEAKDKYEWDQILNDDDGEERKNLPLIGNGELLKEFNFYDGLILKLEHLPVEQAIVMQICEILSRKEIPGKFKVATLRFDGVENLKYNYLDFEHGRLNEVDHPRYWRLDA